MFLDIFPLEALPFFYRIIELWLSCNISVLVTYPCDSRRYLLQGTIGIISSPPTGSDTIKLLLMRFLIIAIDYTDPFTIETVASMCLFVSRCI